MQGIVERKLLLQEGTIFERAVASHPSAALTNVWFLARFMMSTLVMRFAVSGAGRCFGITLSVLHSAMMTAFAR